MAPSPIEKRFPAAQGNMGVDYVISFRFLDTGENDPREWAMQFLTSPR